jgi:alkanesulfonate monooxygenase SsuD/methylene tetrahydromethanopterin reductase-like flavin-dependent oxidoreductase (luciferase family)
MFRFYAFTEMGYPHLPPLPYFENNRVSTPNSFFDPDYGYELYKKCYDIYAAADDLGLDVMVNEHHSTATCLNSVMPLSMAILARETKNARILTLGNPMAHRADPVRVAEEMATVDVISRGRTDIGFVRGVPQEVLAVNSSAVDMKSRMWEAIDLVVKAWTANDGPFNWEGEHFHHRQVNIWPRPYQQPHPPIWSPTLNPGSAGELADRDYVVATLGGGKYGYKAIFDNYRARYTERTGESAPLERFALGPQIYVGSSNQEADDEGLRLQAWYREAGRHYFQYTDVPAYMPASTRAKLLRVKAQGLDPWQFARPAGPTSPTLAEMATMPMSAMTDAGYMIVGDADRVFEQLRDLFDFVGGFGSLLGMVHYWTMTLDSAVKSMQRFAKDVMPRFIEEVYLPTVRGTREVRRPVPAAS